MDARIAKLQTTFKSVLIVFGVPIVPRHDEVTVFIRASFKNVEFV
jgi:hypothetical protein